MLKFFVMRLYFTNAIFTLQHMRMPMQQQQQQRQPSPQQRGSFPPPPAAKRQRKEQRRPAELAWQCNQCSMKFATQQQVDSHIDRVHISGVGVSMRPHQPQSGHELTSQSEDELPIMPVMVNRRRNRPSNISTEPVTIE